MFSNRHFVAIKNIVILFVLFVTAEAIVSSCAQIAAPVGGEKDTIAPVLLRSIPDTFATNFKEQRIMLEFDEFFNMKNTQQKLIISPPLENKPKVMIRGKKAFIDLNNQLADSTTYTLNFGDIIQDVNENNPIPDFQFVFATGENIDSLQISGKIRNAFDLKPVENIFVMAYNSPNDSLPLQKRPNFFDKTDENGVFSIKNIKPGKYRIFALNDMNNNYLFDLPNEDIAFIDSLYQPKAIASFLIDTLKIKKDTLEIDSIVQRQKIDYLPDSVYLFLFNEQKKVQNLTNSAREDSLSFVLRFNKTLDNLPKINTLNFSPPEKWFHLSKNQSTDTLTYWILDSAFYKLDTMKLSIAYEKLDSTQKRYTNIDTIALSYRPRTAKAKKERRKTPRKKNKDEEKNVEKKFNNFALTSNVQNKGNLELNNSLSIFSPVPIKKFEPTKIHFLKVLNDSVLEPQEFNFKQDTLNEFRFYIHTQILPKTKYQLKIDSTALTDLYARQNQALSLEFDTKSEDEYGTLQFNFSGIETNMIIQMLNDEKVLREYFIEPQETNIEIKYINPGKYTFKAIVDSNKNKKWDTGNYLENRQAEKVIFFDEKITVKANFESITPWHFKP